MGTGIGSCEYTEEGRPDPASGLSSSSSESVSFEEDGGGAGDGTAGLEASSVED